VLPQQSILGDIRPAVAADAAVRFESFGPSLSPANILLHQPPPGYQSLNTICLPTSRLANFLDLLGDAGGLSVP
jgi:hypothetical protein